MIKYLMNFTVETRHYEVKCSLNSMLQISFKNITKIEVKIKFFLFSNLVEDFKAEIKMKFLLYYKNVFLKCRNIYLTEYVNVILKIIKN